MHRISVAAALAAAVACAFGTAPASGATATSYSGQATAVRASVLGITTTFADTEPLPSSGGSRKASFVGATIPGVLTAGALAASTSGRGNHSRSSASAGDVTLDLLGSRIEVVALGSEAQASCKSEEPEVSGGSEIAGLVVNGEPIAVVELPNVTIPLPAGLTLVLNEQTNSTGGNHGEMTVNAVHLTGPGVDIVLGSSYADIDCPQ